MRRNLQGFFIVVMLITSSCLKAQEVKVSEELENAAFETYETIRVEDPTSTDPVSVGVNLVWGPQKETMAIVIKVLIADDWHIYAKQRGNSPFILTEVKTELPKAVKLIGEWLLPDAEYYSDELDIYEGELLFIGYYTVDDKLLLNNAKAGLYYQACDPNQCFPPVTKMEELKF